VFVINCLLGWVVVQWKDHDLRCMSREAWNRMVHAIFGIESFFFSDWIWKMVTRKLISRSFSTCVEYV